MDKLAWCPKCEGELLKNFREHPDGLSWVCPICGYDTSDTVEGQGE